MANKDVLTGEHFIHGDAACAEGGLAAGCRFFAGYPITPATEVAERMAKRLPEVGGVYIQMEDEIASMAAILGASWGGVKVYDLDFRSGLLSHDGEYRSGNDDGDTVCGGEHPAGRTVHRFAHHWWDRRT